LIASKHDELANCLLDQKVVVNEASGAERVSPLMEALEVGNIAIARRILAVETLDIEKKDREGRNALHYALQFSPELFEEVRKKGASLEGMAAKGKSPFDSLLATGSVEKVKLLLKEGLTFSGCGTLPLIAALDGPKEKVEEMLELLIDFGEDPAKKDAKIGEVPLIKAIIQHPIEVLAILLRGVKDSVKASAAVDSIGMTPMLTAHNLGNKEAVRLLLKRGFNLKFSEMMKKGSSAALCREIFAMRVDLSKDWKMLLGLHMALGGVPEEERAFKEYCIRGVLNEDESEAFIPLVQAKVFTPSEPSWSENGEGTFFQRVMDNVKTLESFERYRALISCLILNGGDSSNLVLAEEVQEAMRKLHEKLKL
jgi:ankyrin repeat protein